MLRVAGTRTEDEGHALDRLSVGRAGDLAGLEHGLQLGGGDDIGGLSVPEVLKFMRIIGDRPRSQHNRPGTFGRFPAVLPNPDVKHAGGTRNRLNLSAEVGPYRRPADDFPGQGFETGFLQFFIRRLRGREFVDVLQIAAETIRVFNQDDLIAGFGRFIGGSHPGQPSPDHQNAPAQILRHKGRRRLRFPGFDQAHAELVFGQHLSVFVVGRVRPDHLFAQIDPFHDRIGAEIENIGHYPRGTSGNYDGIDLRLLDLGTNQGCPFGTAKEGVFPADRGFVLTRCHLRQGRAVESVAKAAAGADIDAYLLFHNATSCTPTEWL